MTTPASVRGPGPGLADIGTHGHELLQASLTKGHTAKTVYELVAPYLHGRETQLINEMLGWYRGQKNGYDSSVAIKYIACLNEVKALLEQLEREIAEGNRAQAKLHATAPE